MDKKLHYTQLNTYSDAELVSFLEHRDDPEIRELCNRVMELSHLRDVEVEADNKYEEAEELKNEALTQLKQAEETKKACGQKVAALEKERDIFKAANEQLRKQLGAVQPQMELAEETADGKQS